MRREGYSYNEIHGALRIPKSTLSGWLRNVVLNSAARARLDGRAKIGSAILIKRNKMQTHRARQRVMRIRNEASKEFPMVAARDLMLVGAALYWAEGYKRPKIRGGIERTGHAVSFVNSDAEMVRIFIRFLKEVLEVSDDSIVVAMRLYPHINEDVALAHWMRVTGMPKAAFRKTTYLISGASKRRRPFNTLPYGTAQITVARTDTFHRLMGWIEEMKKRF